ncbi:phage tail protein [Cryptosporangium sp. NPDC051539]|uniref:phage tail protein n=1 Tax=Cryptosporangium sp. NPDC051539 TaxID=3363962 RepID=UPI0037969C5A
MIYELLPAEHRRRDAELGHPLRSLLAPVEAEYQRLRDGIDATYANWFVETCAADVLPLIGALLGVDDGAGTTRASVADAVRVRRIEGTAAGLARAVRNATGWPTRVVESLPLVAMTQHVRRIRPDAVRTPDLRDPARPQDRALRTADVRGPYLPNHVRVHVYRTEAQPMYGVHPRVAPPGHWARTFDPGGRDRPLYARTDPPVALDHLTLRRLAREGDLDRVLRIELAGQAVPADRIRTANLGIWRQPDADVVAVDPVRGRFALGTAFDASAAIRADLAFGGRGDLGAGPGDRRSLLDAVGAAPPASANWQFVVTAGHDLAEAVRAWDARRATAGGGTGVIRIADNAPHRGSLTLTAAGDERLIVYAADGACPYVDGSVTVAGAVVLAGLRVEGAVSTGDDSALVLTGCTVGGVVSTGPDALRIHRCVSGPIRSGRAALTVSESVVHGDIDATGAEVTFDAVTLLGGLNARTLDAADSILAGPVTLTGAAPGFLRHCSAPTAPDGLRREHCSPDGVVPRFESTDPDHPAFGQLSAAGPAEIARGGQDGEEMGAYRFLRQPAGLDEVRAQFDRHLRLGLTADVTLAT